MKLPNTAHTSRPWRIHELTPDFRLEDVWALPTPGGPDDFPRLVRQSSGTLDGSPARPASCGRSGGRSGSCSAGTAPTPASAPGCPRSATGCRPICATRRPGHFDALRHSLYLTDDEFAAEIANRTVHGVMHLGWVPDGTGGYRGQMAVLVKPNGLFGTVYMAAIMPFRYLIVYPALMGMIGREWRERVDHIGTENGEPR